MRAEGPDHSVVRFSVRRAVRIRNHAAGLVLVPRDVLQHLAGIAGQRRFGNLVDRRFRSAVESRFRLGRIAQQFIDLVMKDERQAGQAKQQQEDR
jgi:hypothetical protein